MAQAQAARGERGGELQHALERRLERRHVEDLRADVAVDAGHLEVRESRREVVGGQRALVRDAELAPAQSRGDVGVRARVDVGIDAQGHRRAPSHRAGDRIEALELRLALHVEAADAGGEGRADLLLALADPGEDDALGPAAGGQHAREFAARDDVEAGTEPREDAEDGEVGVRLDRVADEMVGAREGVVEGAPGRLDRGPRVDVAGGPVAARDFREAHALHPQLAVVVADRAHGNAGESAFGGSGRRSGPFWPQAASASASARTASARIMRRSVAQPPRPP